MDNQYNQPPYAQPPYGFYYPPPPAAKKKGPFATVLLVLFILSFFSLFLGLFLAAVNVDYDLGDFIAKIWYMLFALPLPLACLVLGIIGRTRGYKCVKNIVTGIIFTALLIIYGSFSFFFGSTYSRDYALVARIGQTVNFELPKEGRIFTTKYEETEASSDEMRLKTDSNVKFTSENEIEAFGSKIETSPLWTASLETKNKILIPPMHQYSQYDYMMICCVGTAFYNEIPPTAGDYYFIFLGYNAETNVLVIVEYGFEIN